MGHYWTTFAATGAPEGAMAWPAYPSTLRLQAGPAEGGPDVVASFKADDCAFWKEQQRLKTCLPCCEKPPPGELCCCPVDPSCPRPPSCPPKYV